jgi:hypothetical protein
MQKRKRKPATVTLSADQEERLAQRASDLAVEKLYAAVGKTAVKRIMLIVGLGVSALVSVIIAKVFSTS